MRSVISAAIAAIAALAMVHVPAGAQTTGGNLKDFVYVMDHDPISTSSDVASAVPGVSLSFESEERGPVLATFCAETQVEGTLEAGVYIDGEQALPGAVNLDENLLHVPLGTSNMGAHCYVWVLPDAAPGTHTVEVRWRKTGTRPGDPSLARMFTRSLLVQFAGAPGSERPPADVSDYEVVVGETATSGTLTKQLRVDCPSGTKALGAGWGVLDSTGAILDGRATYFEPASDGSHWLANAAYSSTSARNWKLRLRVICASVGG